MINYYQTVILYHNIKGYNVAGLSDKLVAQTVRGIKMSQNYSEDAKDPFDYRMLEKMYRKVEG